MISALKLVWVMGVFSVGVLLGFSVTNSIRMRQIEILREEIKLERYKNQELEKSLRQCNVDLSAIYGAYTDIIIELKKMETDYSRRLKLYAEEINRLRISGKYNIVPDGSDECQRMKSLLDKFIEVEKDE